MSYGVDMVSYSHWGMFEDDERAPTPEEVRQYDEALMAVCRDRSPSALAANAFYNMLATL